MLSSVVQITTMINKISKTFIILFETSLYVQIFNVKCINPLNFNIILYFLAVLEIIIVDVEIKL